jgi:hypothetical protein
MEKIKNWFRELSNGKTVLIFVIVVLFFSWGASELFGKKYEKFYPNKCSRTWAVAQFKNICGSSSPESSGDGIEYSKFYDNGSQAMNDFMILARSLDSKYANGEFRHMYVSRKERIYQCYDRNKKLIALRYVRHNAGFYMGEWEKAFYQIQLYIED